MSISEFHIESGKAEFDEQKRLRLQIPNSKAFDEQEGMDTGKMTLKQ